MLRFTQIGPVVFASKLHYNLHYYVTVKVSSVKITVKQLNQHTSRIR